MHASNCKLHTVAATPQTGGDAFMLPQMAHNVLKL